MHKSIVFTFMCYAWTLQTWYTVSVKRCSFDICSTKQLRDSVPGCTEEFLHTQRPIVANSQTQTATAEQQQQFKKNDRNQSSRTIWLCYIFPNRKHKFNIQIGKRNSVSRFFGFLEVKTIVLCFPWFSFYSRLISPANRVISRIIVNPVSSPAFWMTKNTTLSW